RPADVSTVVADDRGETVPQLRSLDLLTSVEADRLGRIAQPDQGIAERGVEFLVVEAEPDQRTPEPERDARRDRHKDHDNPEHRARELETEDVQWPGEIPENGGERHHRNHRTHRS